MFAGTDGSLTTSAVSVGASAVALEPVSLQPPADPALPRHAFTVDVEDWYQSCVDFDAPISERVVRNVDRMLHMLDECSAKGTFFVQGMVAESFPGLVRTLVDEGHEVQSHGHTHRPLNEMSPGALRNELERGKKTVEDAAGMSVTSFRAQDFSILSDNLWAVAAVAEAGFATDSSIFPMRSRNYGIENWELGPHRLTVDGRTILEVPVAVWAYRRLRIPVAGGGYFRALPGRVLERAVRSIEASGRPAVVYCHPYEFAPNELAQFPGVSRRTRLHQGLGRNALAARMQRLLGKLGFGRMDDVLAAWGVTSPAGQALTR